jgi:hypothetical protein
MNFQEIANILVSVLPENWTEVKLFSHVDQASYEFFFFVKIDGDYINNFDLEQKYSITRKDMRTAFRKLYENMQESQNKDGWKVATFIMDSKGNFKIEFDYDITPELIDYEYKQHWKIKYLK